MEASPGDLSAAKHAVQTASIAPPTQVGLRSCRATRARIVRTERAREKIVTAARRAAHPGEPDNNLTTLALCNAIPFPSLRAMAPKLQKQCKQKVAAAQTVRNKPAAAQNVQKTVRKKPAAAQTAQQAQGQVLTPLGREWDSLVAVDQAIKDAKHELAWLDVCIRGALETGTDEALKAVLRQSQLANALCAIFVNKAMKAVEGRGLECVAALNRDSVLRSAAQRQ